MKRRAAVAFVVGSGAGFLAACGPDSDTPDGPDVPTPSWPGMPVRDLNGQARDLAQHSAGPRLINVWALWCGPCRAELPGLQRLRARLAPHGVQVLTLALADDAFAVREFLAQRAPGLPAFLLAPRAPAVQQLGLRSLPQTFAVAADGLVLARWRVARDWGSAAVAADLQQLLRSG